MEDCNYEKDYFTHEGYIQGYRDFDAHKGRVDKLIKLANPRTVLDVGCGYGFMVRRLLDKGIYAVGIDVSEWCEKISKNIIPNNFIRHDLRQPLPFMDKQFDLLYCEGVLEHIEEEHVIPIMKEFERVAHERIFQISLSNHPNAAKEKGHINLKDPDWWTTYMPERTWLALQELATEENMIWVYKG